MICNDKDYMERMSKYLAVMHIFKILFYDGTIDDNDFVIVEEYMAKKYRLSKVDILRVGVCNRK